MPFTVLAAALLAAGLSAHAAPTAAERIAGTELIPREALFARARHRADEPPT